MRKIWILSILFLCSGCKTERPKQTDYQINKLSFEEMNYPFNEKTFNYSGNKVVYIDEGNGVPILFLHGQASDLLNFEPVYPLFVQDYRIIALDYPGFGKSDKPRIEITEDFIIGLIDELFSSVKIKSAILIGHSYGGYIAMLYGVAHPERVQAMVLVSTAGIQQFSSMVQTAFRNSFTVESIISTTTEKAIGNYRDGSVNWSAEMERYALRRAGLLSNGGEEYENYAHAMVQAMELMLDTSVRDRIGEKKIPTLLVWGKQDPLIPYKIAEETLKYIPHARLVTIDECGHFSMLEYPQRFYELVSEFVKEQM